MKLTNNQIMEAEAAIGKIMDIKWPIKVSLDLALLSADLERRKNAFIKVRDRIFKTYAIKVDQEEGQLKFTSTEEGKEEENLKGFQKDFSELLNTEVDDVSTVKIKLPTEIDGKQTIIEPELLKALIGFIEV